MSMMIMRSEENAGSFIANLLRAIPQLGVKTRGCGLIRNKAGGNLKRFYYRHVATS